MEMNDADQSDVRTVPVEVLRDLVHDMRNPLVAAVGFLNLLERAGPGPAAERYTAALRESIETMRCILERARGLYGGMDLR